MSVRVLGSGRFSPGRLRVPPVRIQPLRQTSRHGLAKEAGLGNPSDPRAVLHVIGLANVKPRSKLAQPDERGRFRPAPQLLSALILWRRVMTMTGQPMDLPLAKRGCIPPGFIRPASSHRSSTDSPSTFLSMIARA
jgi:hypothetical protein